MTDQRLIKIDTEHFAIRLLVPVLTIGLTLGVYVGGRLLLSEVLADSVNPVCVALPIAAVMLFGGSYVVEAALKQVMPSRRAATLDDDALVVSDARRKPPQLVAINWAQTVNVLAWRFEVRRRTRVPKGWFCMAVQLLQDEQSVILYSFFEPKAADALPGYHHFVRLRPRKETESNQDLAAVAEQRRLLKLEDERWDDGAELHRKDFAAVLDKLQQYVWKE